MPNTSGAYPMPYPNSTAVPDVPGDALLLAQATDTAFTAIAGIRRYANLAAINALGSPRAHDRAVALDTGIEYRYSGSAWGGWESDWVTYAPTLTGVTLGTGSTTRYRYKFVAGLVLVDYSIRLGTGGSFTGQPSLTLPVTAEALRVNFQEYPGTSFASNVASNIFPMSVLADSASVTAVKFWARNTGAYVAVAATVPLTWALNSVIRGQFTMVPA